MCKVSVIIPVYGVERYVERCARSLFGQTLQEGIEFIFIDDYSPDNSIEIIKNTLRDYPHRIPQTRIIRLTKNAGISYVRNLGVCEANGKYVINCDSDDWVEPDMYESLLSIAEYTSADIVKCGYFDEQPDKSISIVKPWPSDKNESLIGMAKSGNLDAYLWTRLVRRIYYQKYQIDTGITLLDDLSIVLPMHRDATVIEILPRPLYHYNRTIPGSMSTLLSKKAIDSAIHVLLKLLDSDFELKVNQGLLNRLKTYLFYYATSLSQYNPSLWRDEYMAKLAGMPLTAKEKITYRLLAHKFDRLNHGLEILTRTVTGKLSLSRILRK